MALTHRQASRTLTTLPLLQFSAHSSAGSSCSSSYLLLPVSVLVLTQSWEREWLECRHVLFPSVRVGRISGSSLWFNVINSHKKVAQNVTARTEHVWFLLYTRLKVTKGQLWVMLTWNHIKYLNSIIQNKPLKYVLKWAAWWLRIVEFAKVQLCLLFRNIHLQSLTGIWPKLALSVKWE